MATESPKASAEKAKAPSDQFTAFGNQAFKTGVEKTLAALNEFNGHSKKNLEATVASTTAATKGAEALTSQALAFSKGALDRHVELMKAYAGVRSLQDAMQLNADYARTSIETYMAEVNNASEIASAAVRETVRPLNERASAAIEALQAAR